MLHTNCASNKYWFFKRISVSRHVCSATENPKSLLSQTSDSGIGAWCAPHNARLMRGSKNLVRHDSDIFPS